MDHRFVVPKSMNMHCHVYTAGIQNPDAFIFRDVAVISMASTLEGLHCIYAVQWTNNSEDGITNICRDMQLNSGPYNLT